MHRKNNVLILTLRISLSSLAISNWPQFSSLGFESRLSWSIISGLVSYDDLQSCLGYCKWRFSIMRISNDAFLSPPVHP